MPELLTKYPNIVLKILSDANVSCGKGTTQSILKTCPKDQFCSLPTGELCVYGTNQIAEMKQLHPVEFLFTADNIAPIGGLVLIAFAIGIWLGSRL